MSSSDMMRYSSPETFTSFPTCTPPGRVFGGEAEARKDLRPLILGRGGASSPCPDLRSARLQPHTTHDIGEPRVIVQRVVRRIDVQVHQPS